MGSKFHFHSLHSSFCGPSPADKMPDGCLWRNLFLGQICWCDRPRWMVSIFGSPDSPSLQPITIVSDFNSYRQGSTGFYGPGKTVNTNSVFTVVTQFITNTGTDSGTLSEIKRFYVQNGVVIPNSQSTIPNNPGNSITAAFCDAQKTAFGDPNIFNQHGGFASMSSALSAGMVLSLSLWDDYASNMLWLDSTFPVTGNPATPGVGRGTCPTTSGVPADVEASSPNSYVVYSNIKVGALNSTYAGTLAPGTGSSSSATSRATTATTATTLRTSSTSSRATSTTSTAPSSSGAPRYGQCGGQPPFAGPYTCVAPYVCTYSTIYYSQCL